MYHLLLVRAPQRDARTAPLAARGVGTMVHDPRSPRPQPAFAGLVLRVPLPVTEAVACEVLPSPTWPGLALDQVVWSPLRSARNFPNLRKPPNGAEMKSFAPKFVLVDSSISGSGGHYLEYAEQVFEAAAHAGFACFLIANRAFKLDPGLGTTTFPVLPLDMWGNNLALRDDNDNSFSEEDRRSLRLHFGRLGLL